jgi:hypothetical protein
MDFSKLDFQIGKDFSDKVRSLLGSHVTPGGKSKELVFHLLVSFSRNRFRLTGDSVGICLQAVLGGEASAFEVFHLDDQIFRFSVCSKQVGLMVLGLNPIACEWFKLGFFLLTDSGLKKALVFAKLDSGPSFSWESSRSKGVAKKSFAQIASARNHPLIGANCTPLVPQKSSRSVFDRLRFPRRSVFDRLRFANSSKQFESGSSQKATSVLGSSGPPSSKPDTVTCFGYYGKRAPASNHLQDAGSKPVICWHYHQRGHIKRSVNLSRGCLGFSSL